MGTIRLQNVSKQFGGQVILRDVSLDLHSGQTAALIGANGVGKTTLFKLIAGDLPPDVGTVTTSKGMEVGYLPQEPNLRSDATLRAAVVEAFDELIVMERKLHELGDRMAAAHDDPGLAELMAQYDRLRARFEAAGGYSFEQRVDEVLGGLGFSTSDYELPVSALSGGQKCRAALGKVLLQERQFLLLDEPTNHLDIDAVRWLEKFLAGHHGGAVIISHDRYLLDRLAERTIEMEATSGGARVNTYPGNYSKYVETRALRALTQQRQYEKDKAFVEKEQAFIAKHMAGQRTNEAKGRQKRLQRRLDAGEFVLDTPSQQRRMKMEFDQPARQATGGKLLVRADELAKRFDDKRLFDDLSLEVYTGQRMGITGPNGTGKTTLLRILLTQAWRNEQPMTTDAAGADGLQHVEADAGEVWIAPAARIGYFAQEPAELDPQQTVVQAICEIRPDFLERDARNYAARFHFTDDDPFKPVGKLSGGEQSRLRFMRLILSAPEVLVLDEPTNHLDIRSREALEEALLEFPGTIIAISHDRYFLDRVAERLLVIRPEGHRLFSGNYSYYIEQVEAEQAAANEAAQRARRRTSKGAPARGQRRDEPQSVYQKMKLPELEEFIAQREQQIAELEPQFGNPAVYREADAVRELHEKFNQLKEELAAAEAAWLERVEQE